jgi:polysaccharide biosynthesis protein PslG
MSRRRTKDEGRRILFLCRSKRSVVRRPSSVLRPLSFVLRPLLLLLLTACTPSNSTPTSLPRFYPLPHLQSPEYGIQAFLWWNVDNKTAWRDADLVRDMGFGWLKQQIAWRDVSNARGGYDWYRTDWVVKLAEERGLKLLIRLDRQPAWSQANPVPNGPPDNIQDFADFCSALAARYPGRIAAYEVWNEPNLAREWGEQPPDPAGYVALLKACYLAIKSADPQAIVISAGMAPTGTDDTAIAMPDDKFFQGIYDAGGAPYFDMLGVHAPGYMNPPERSPDDTEADPALQVRWITFRHVEDIRALMVVNGDADKQIAITEMGWTSDPIDVTYHWYAVSEEEKADYLVRAYQYAKHNWQPWIGLMSAIYITDPTWTEANEQYWWAITRPTPPGDPAILLPAYTALKHMQK